MFVAFEVKFAAYELYAYNFCLVCLVFFFMIKNKDLCSNRRSTNQILNILPPFCTCHLPQQLAIKIACAAVCCGN